VIARSFARIFYRNCINLGLLAVTAPEISERALDDQVISIDLERRTATLDGAVTPLRGLHPFILEAVEAGGFVQWARAHPPEEE
jgi:3-isopropylmalate/(R)-2-methylmalate dehydratase small subunit